VKNSRFLLKKRAFWIEFCRFVGLKHMFICSKCLKIAQIYLKMPQNRSNLLQNHSKSLKNRYFPIKISPDRCPVCGLSFKNERISVKKHLETTHLREMLDLSKELA
jgi:DNA repair exonuclease SbcCD ATPase subunit